MTHYGWRRDIPDFRDLYYLPRFHELANLPDAIDLTSQCPPIYDQGQLGSCTANAIAAALEFDQMKQKLSPIFVPSRLFIYYNERAMENSVDSDSGAEIRDGVKSVNKTGVCSEDEWPYDITQFAVKPSQQCYDDATKHHSLKYSRIRDGSLASMHHCLASGYPFVFGFTVYESFENNEVASTGHAPMPDPSEQVLGGHAVLAVGYDTKKEWFICRNSWGTGWGMQGYFTLPFDYLTGNLASDFWVIKTVQ